MKIITPNAKYLFHKFQDFSGWPLQLVAVEAQTSSLVASQDEIILLKQNSKVRHSGVDLN